jgi:uncharacterized protein YkwD
MAMILVALVHLAWACAAVAAPAPGDAPDAWAAERQQCVEITNRYRASVEAPALRVSPALEAYARDAAANDGRAHKSHAYFRRTNGAGIARAENVVPWWPLSELRSVSAVVERGLEMMWKEGPKGAHRRNMAGAYTEVGCGVLVDGDEVTVVQAFR